MKLRSILTILILSAYSIAYSAGNRANFLSHGPSVEAYGRGETGTAFYTGINSFYYNPSLLAFSKQTTIDSSFYSLFEGSKYMYLGFGFPLKNDIYMAVSGIDLMSGDIELRNNINDTPQKANASSSLYTLSIAKEFKKLYSLNMGLNLKYIYEDMYVNKGSSYGIDLGVSKEFMGPEISDSKSKINIGLAVQNVLQPALKLDSEEEQFAQVSRLGIAFLIPVYSRAFSTDILGVFSDLVYQDNYAGYYGGLEYKLLDAYTFRAGYFNNHTTLGAGLKFSNFSLNYSIDLMDYTSFNRFGLTYYMPKKEKTEVVAISGKKTKVNNSLMKEAKEAVRESRKLQAQMQKDIKRLFNSAKNDYKKERYLNATEKFGEISLKYPENTAAKEYYDKITALMEKEAKDSEGIDLAGQSYAKGYVAYNTQKYSDAINEWEKFVQITSKNDEVSEYITKTKNYLNDMERQAKERKVLDKASMLFESGTDSFNSAMWVGCIKKMEEIQELCKVEAYQSLIQWQEKSDDLLQKALKELSKTVVYIKHEASKPKAKLQEVEINVEGSQKKYNEGLILYAQGKISDAINIWEIALRLNPSNEKASKALQKAREELDSSTK
jgi:tetratricopeptide (TPR) repeat protein